MKRISRLLIFLLISSAPAVAAPRAAVIIDDFGLTYKSSPPDEEWMALDSTMTFAVMPKSPRTISASTAAAAAGKEVIIHFPFDPYQKYELAPDSATVADVRKARILLETARKQIPSAVGLNNHRSYLATMNAPLMKEFMKLLKPTGLYFIDSTVSSKSVAYREAKAAGIKATRNYIFLDTAQDHSRKFCDQMFKKAMDYARGQGRVVMIGHHYYRSTMECLRTNMATASAHGVEFVKASELAH